MTGKWKWSSQSLNQIPYVTRVHMIYMQLAFSLFVGMSGQKIHFIKDLLEIFELSSLEERRLNLKLGLLFKILHEFCYFPETESFTTLRNYCSSRSTHCLQLTVPFAHTNSYKYSFFPHTIQQWNSLDTSCVFANSYTSFMHSLS